MPDLDAMTFAQELRAPGGPGLARGNLLFAREIAYPALQPSAYIARLDAWAEMAVARCPADAPAAARAACLSEVLFGEIGLRGNEADYYDPRNSYLNAVMDRRLGLPIALSAIYLEVARRMKLPAYGVGLPGHFVVAAPAPHDRAPLLLDPFHGGVLLEPEDVTALVRSATGYDGPFMRGWLEPVTVSAMLSRMLLNLRGLYVRNDDWPTAIAVLERLRLLQPGHPEHLRDLGLLHQRAGSLRRATIALEDYLLVAQDAPDAERVRQTLNVILQQLTRLN
jgi:regulator of sirC expression with transglutaminase-like and TPR domain